MHGQYGIGLSPFGKQTKGTAGHGGNVVGMGGVGWNVGTGVRGDVNFGGYVMIG